MTVARKVPAKKAAPVPALLRRTSAPGAATMDFEADAAPTKREPEGNELKRAIALGQLMRRQAAEVARIEAELASAKEAMVRTQREDLPMLMAELELKEFTLEDGYKIITGEKFTTSISEERMPTAIEWLIKNKADGIVKTFMSIPFGRGERKEAVALYKKLSKELKREIAMKQNIHPQTLKAFVKEWRENGTPIPVDTFGIFTYQEAELIAPKAKAAPRRARTE